MSVKRGLFYPLHCALSTGDSLQASMVTATINSSEVMSSAGRNTNSALSDRLTGPKWRGPAPDAGNLNMHKEDRMFSLTTEAARSGSWSQGKNRPCYSHEKQHKTTTYLEWICCSFSSVVLGLNNAVTEVDVCLLMNQIQRQLIHNTTQGKPVNY